MRLNGASKFNCSAANGGRPARRHLMRWHIKLGVACAEVAGKGRQAYRCYGRIVPYCRNYRYQVGYEWGRPVRCRVDSRFSICSTGTVGPD